MTTIDGRRTRRPSGAIRPMLEAAARAATSECIILSNYKRRPQVMYEGHVMAAARAVWIIAHGDPGDAWVLHRCSGGSGALGCINVNHLYLGDSAQNAQDAVESGRNTRGERQGLHKLTEDDVRSIRRLYIKGHRSRRGNAEDLAYRYGVHHATIRKIANRRIWAWLD